MPQAAFPTTLAAISYAIADRIVEAGAGGPNTVIFSRNPGPFPTQGYPQVVIGRGSFRPIAPHVDGMGRYQATQEGTIRVTVNWRSALDRADQDEYRLLGNRGLEPPTEGLEVYAHKVINALIVEWLLDADGNLLTVEPLEMVGNAAPVPYAGDDNFAWEGVTLTFRFRYTPLLDLPE